MREQLALLSIGVLVAVVTVVSTVSLAAIPHKILGSGIASTVVSTSPGRVALACR